MSSTINVFCKAGFAIHRKGYFFTDGQDKPLDKDKIEGYLKRTVRRASIVRMSGNDLRKTPVAG
jgi:hypothetical protein